MSRATKCLRWLNWETSRRHVTHDNFLPDVSPNQASREEDILSYWSKYMAKLGDLSHATLFGVAKCLPGWLNMRVTSEREQHVARVICMSQRQEMLPLSPRNICVSLAINFVALFKASEVAKLGDTDVTSMSPARCLLD